MHTSGTQQQTNFSHTELRAGIPSRSVQNSVARLVCGFGTTMTDFRIHVGFWDHPKIVKLIRRHGIEGAVALQRLYGYCAMTDGHHDGTLYGMDDEDIEIAMKWTGKPIVDDLNDLKLLDMTVGGMAIHDFADVNGWLAGKQSRVNKARKAAAARWTEKEDDAQAMPGSESSNAPSIDSDAPSMQNDAPSNAPYPSSPYPSNTNTRSETKTKIDPVPLNEEQSATADQTRSLTSQSKEIVDYWAVQNPEDAGNYSGRAWIQLRTRLTEGRTVDDIKQGIDGIRADDWPARSKNMSLWHVVKNPEALKRFMAMAKPPKGEEWTEVHRELAAFGLRHKIGPPPDYGQIVNMGNFELIEIGFHFAQESGDVTWARVIQEMEQRR